MVCLLRLTDTPHVLLRLLGRVLVFSQVHRRLLLLCTPCRAAWCIIRCAAAVALLKLLLQWLQKLLHLLPLLLQQGCLVPVMQGLRYMLSCISAGNRLGLLLLLLLQVPWSGLHVALLLNRHPLPRD